MNTDRIIREQHLDDNKIVTFNVGNLPQYRIDEYLQQIKDSIDPALLDEIVIETINSEDRYGVVINNRKVFYIDINGMPKNKAVAFIQSFSDSLK